MLLIVPTPPSVRASPRFPSTLPGRAAKAWHAVASSLYCGLTGATLPCPPLPACLPAGLRFVNMLLRKFLKEERSAPGPRRCFLQRRPCSKLAPMQWACAHAHNLRYPAAPGRRAVCWGTVAPEPVVARLLPIDSANEAGTQQKTRLPMMMGLWTF